LAYLQLSINLQQWGWKLGGSVQIDNLAYNYQNNSNKLTKVTDANNNPLTKLGDFKDGTNTGDDYTYDVNGNLKRDYNKDIGNNTTDGITYNHLNLPSQIWVSSSTIGGGKGTINYTYDATGNKLQKVTVENPSPANGNKTITTTTNYVNGFVYESKNINPSTNPEDNYTDRLQFVRRRR
jgi:hypothetical protein